MAVERICNMINLNTHIPNDVTIEDLSFARHGHCVQSGSHLWHGKMIQDHAFVEDYVTKFGTFSPKEWNKLALKVVKDTGKYELYLAVKEYCRNNCAGLHTDEEYSEHALSCMTSHAYESWKNFDKRTYEQLALSL